LEVNVTVDVPLPPWETVMLVAASVNDPVVPVLVLPTVTITEPPDAAYVESPE
jgi:hypothetical protein